MTAKVETSVVIKKPIGVVFVFMADPEKDMLWQSGVLSSRNTSGDPMGVGTTEEQEVLLLGRRIKSTLEVSEYEPNRKIEYKTILGPVPFKAGYIFDSLAEGDTKVTFYAEGDVGGFFKLAEPLVARVVQRQWEANLSTLKDLLEAQAEDLD